MGSRETRPVCHTSRERMDPPPHFTLFPRHAHFCWVRERKHQNQSTFPARRRSYLMGQPFTKYTKRLVCARV